MGRRIAVELLVVAAIGLALGTLGPFGTYEVPLAARLAYWLGFTLLGYAIFRPMLVAGEWLAAAAEIPRIAADLLVVTVGAFPLALLIGFAIAGMRPAALDGGFAILYLQVWAIGLAIDLFMTRFFSDRTPSRQSAGPAPEPPLSGRPAFFDRLPPGFGDRLLCLGMEDHYVRAYGEHGSTLILMRLRDAIAELGGIDGMQVHRSWWVSRAAVLRVEREGRSRRLILDNGMTVPVARSYAADLPGIGWAKALGA